MVSSEISENLRQSLSVNIKKSEHKTHVYVVYVDKNKTHIFVFYVKPVHFMDIKFKTHKYMFYMHYFCFKLVFRALSENLFKCSEIFFSYRIIPVVFTFKQFYLTS